MSTDSGGMERKNLYMFAIQCAKENGARKIPEQAAIPSPVTSHKHENAINGIGCKTLTLMADVHSSAFFIALSKIIW